jgi:two-component system cell cycle response regulator DivK
MVVTMSNSHVLVIEDNEQNLYLMRFLLEKHGFAVSAARSGREGLEMVDRLDPDLIVLDVQLPEMDGYAVAAELRRQPRSRETPIVVVTSHAMVGDREKALGSGATDYIEKPIDPRTFVDRIRKHLPSRASAAERRTLGER